LFLLVRLGDSYAIWHWRSIRYKLGQISFGELERLACGLWLNRGIDFAELRLILDDARRIKITY